ncbi:MAG: aminotransferase class V-fold PLP-dependent enzyme, partial [Steroidobacteraceae bacterium]
IIFTSGATESNNLAVLGVARANADRGRHVVTSRIEHKSVLDACKRLEKEGFRITWLAPDRTGRVDPDAVRGALQADTILVSIMHVSNEIGVIQDIGAIGQVCRAAQVAFHTDAAQSVGRIAVDAARLPVDFMSLASHKLYGPKGIGALYLRRGARALLGPQWYGGSQEQGLRPGTLPTHQSVGFGTAAELILAESGDNEAETSANVREAAQNAPSRGRSPEFERVAALGERLWTGIAGLPGIHLNGAGAPRVPHILNVSFEGVDGESLVAALDSLALSTGAACSSASGDPSYVLRALGRSTRLAESSLRLSLGRYTTADQIDYAAAEVVRAVKRLRRIAPSGRQDAACRATLDSGADGLIVPAGTRVLRGEAGGPDEEVWVRFHVAVDGDDIVKDARFEALGCPHTLAVASWIASRLPGHARAEGVLGGPQAWAAALDVPIEKLGRLLAIEDALTACLGLAQAGLSEADRR